MTSSYINYYWWIYWQNVSICQSVGNFVNTSDTSLYGIPSLSPTVIPSVKSSIKNTHHRTFWFFKIPFIPMVIPSVFTDWLFMSINIDGFSDGIKSVNKYHSKIPT